MAIREPAEDYRFYQDRLARPPRWEVRGDPDYPGNYTVEDEFIVDKYNASTHWRSQDELNMMGLINEAYHRNEDRRLAALLKEAAEKFQANAAPSVAGMWKKVFKLYRKGIGS